MRPEDRLRELGRMTAPDLWPEIGSRQPSEERARAGPSRLATVAVGLAVAAAGLGIAAVAFLGDPGRRSVTPGSPPPGPTPTRPVIATPTPGFEGSHSDPWGAPTALSVTCTDEGIQLLSAQVPAQLDGVHIVWDNPGGATHLLDHMRGPRPAPSGDRTLTYRRDPDPDGLTRVVAPWPPGRVEIACEAPGVDQRSETVHVTDPQGLWISPALPCDETVLYERRERTPYADVESAVRENIDGVLPTDEIVRAGYPQYTFPAASMLVVRDGNPVAIIILPYVFGEDFWIPLSGEICVGSGIMGA